MTTVRPLSPSTFKEFVTCPASFHASRVTKTHPQVYNAAGGAGTDLHKAFEYRMRDKVPLPSELAIHEANLKKLEDFPCTSWHVEQRVGINKRGEAVEFWDGDFWRFIIDYTKINLDHEVPFARVVDYKSGNPKYADERQLQIAALYTFIRYPEVQLVNSQFYFTKDQTFRKKVWSRAEADGLWAGMAPDILQWREAFKTDTWQPRPNALCKGWCAKTDCKHWEPKRERY
jgi:hypothetical protein